MSRNYLPRDMIVVHRSPMSRNLSEVPHTVIGASYYGVILPPEVDAKMLQVWAGIDALELDVRAGLAKKYGLAVPGGIGVPPTYKTPVEKWEPLDLQRASNFDAWTAGTRKGIRAYVEASPAWKWVGSNSLAAYKQAESWEEDLTKWRSEWRNAGVGLTAPEPSVNAKANVDFGAITDALKVAVLGLGIYAGYRVFMTFGKSKPDAAPAAPSAPAAQKV